MYRPPPLRGRPVLANKNVLLIDRCQATREVRAAVLRSPGPSPMPYRRSCSFRTLHCTNLRELTEAVVRRTFAAKEFPP